MSPHLLPFEVLSHILDSVNNKADLCSISLASRALREEGQRALFRHPGMLEIELPKLAGNKFLDSIIASPNRLALAVHSFDTRLVLQHQAEPQGCDINCWKKFLQRNKSDRKNFDEIINFIEQLGGALVLMTNLKNLHVVATRNKELTEAVPPLPSILRRCTFRLHHFHWEHVVADNELIMSEFLPHQYALRSLALPIHWLQFGQQHARTLQSYSAVGRLNLNLESLCGPAEMTLGLLGRTDGSMLSPRCLRWTMRIDKRSVISTHKLRHLAKALSNVSLFHFDHNPLDLQPITSEYGPVDIFSFLDNLRVLRFRTTDIQEITQEHLDALARLPRLQVLVLVIELRILMYEHEHNIAKTVIEKLFSCCANLEYIDLERWMGRSPSERLTRYISKRHGVPKHGEYSWDNRHQFVQIGESDT